MALATTLLTPEATGKTVEIATTPAGFLGSRGAKSALQAGCADMQWEECAGCAGAAGPVTGLRACITTSTHKLLLPPRLL